MIGFARDPRHAWVDFYALLKRSLGLRISVVRAFLTPEVGTRIEN